MMWGPGFRRQLGVITNSNKISDLRFFIPLNSDINYIRPNLRVQIFDGEDDYVELDSFSVETNWTVEFKIKPILPTGSYNGLIGNDESGRGYIVLNGTNTGLIYEDADIDGGHSINFNAGINITDGEYHILKIINDNNLLKAYVDGILQTDTEVLTNGKLEVTKISNVRSSAFFNGNINYVKIWSDATQTNLVAHYDLTSAKLGLNQVKDLSGNGNHGTSFGKGEFTRTTPATFVDHNGIIGTAGTDVARFDGMRFINDDKGFSNYEGENAIEFDGSANTYVNFGNINNSPVSGLTLMGWFNSKELKRAGLFNKYETSGNMRSYYFETNNGSNLAMLVSNNGTQFSSETTGDILELNKNYFITSVWAPNERAKIYVNGVLQSTTQGDEIATYSSLYSNPDVDFEIGRAQHTTTREFNGIIDNPITLNTALTGEQIMQQYLFSKKGLNYLVAPENVVGAWKLDDTTSTIIDYSGNGNNGTFFSGGIESTPTLVEGVYSSDTSIVGNGIMVYEGGTNLLTWSEELDNATGGWTESSVTVSLNQDISPDRTLTADRIIPTVGSGSKGISKAIALLDNTSYSFSVYCKSNDFQWIRLASTAKTGSTSSSFFDVQNGTTGTVSANHTASIQQIGDYYRCTIIMNTLTGVSTPNFFVRLADADGDNNVTGDGSSYNTFWGAMLNEGTFPRPYIKTEATTESTTADVYFNDVSDVITQSIGKIEGDIIIDGVNASATPVIFDLSDKTVGNRIYAYINDSLQVNLRILTGGVEQALITSTSTLTAGTSANIKATYEDDNITLYLNGTSEGTDTSATIPTGLTTLSTGCDYNSANQLNGKVKNLKYSNKIN